VPGGVEKPLKAKRLAVVSAVKVRGEAAMNEAAKTFLSNSDCEMAVEEVCVAPR
jgi:hypothetical protein